MTRYYRLTTYDERDNNYVTMQENLYGACSVYQSCIPYFCLTCHRVNRKAVFENTVRFEAGPRIRVKTGREFAHSGEGFLLVKTRVLKLLRRHRVVGYAARPILLTDWHVLRVTATVPYKKFKPTYDGRGYPACKACGYLPYYGIAKALHQIGVPQEDNTFFTPKYERPQHQDVYLTEKVALMLEANGARGAALSRLLDEEEYELECIGTPQALRKIKARGINL